MGIGNAKAIAVLGDSISNGYYDEEGLGWISRLSVLLNKNDPNGYFIRNHAVSGDRIFDVKYRLFGSVERNVDALIIAVGANDTYIFGDRDDHPVLGMDLRLLLWDDVLRFAKGLTSNIFVFGILPVDELKVPARFMDDGRGKFFRNDHIVEYNKAIKKICTQYDIKHINFHEMFLEAGHEALLADDVHPNAKGHELLAQWAYEELKDKI
ncbi:MAG: hypothetical protein KDJ50_07820 [Alphaproteobacteria bacterium]|nr:hypothetical protein [Alphaproteobacteria bacterium]